MGAFIDLIGQKFGELTVLFFVGRRKGQSIWHCVCSCGTEKDIRAGVLRNGHTKSCGKKDCAPLTVEVDLSGKQFGYLTVVKYELRKGWLCNCICGNTTNVKTYSLEKGHTKSCGCKSNEMNAQSNTLPDNMGFINYLYGRYKRNARERELEFELSKDELRALISANCTYCNREPAVCSHHKRQFVNGDFKFNGIDRKHNEIGYIGDNCITCCIVCNRAKGDMTYEEFMVYIKRLANFNKHFVV